MSTGTPSADEPAKIQPLTWDSSGNLVAQTAEHVAQQTGAAAAKWADEGNTSAPKPFLVRRTRKGQFGKALEDFGLFGMQIVEIRRRGPKESIAVPLGLLFMFQVFVMFMLVQILARVLLVFFYPLFWAMVLVGRKIEKSEQPLMQRIEM